MNRFTTIPSRGFTLIEIIAVVALTSLMMFLAVPAIQGTVKSSRLRDAATLLSNRIQEAQQLAITTGSLTEVRLLMANDLAGGAMKQLRKLQVMILQASANGDAIAAQEQAFIPASGVDSFEESITMSNRNDLNSLRSLGFKAYDVSGTRTRYLSIRFHPDGSTSLPADGCWFVTVIEARDEDETGIPKNFITIQVDAATGRLRLFQPE